MKPLLTIIRAIVALVAVAAPLLAAAPASLVNFTRVSEWPGGQQGDGLAVAGNYAYLGAGDPDLRIIDVSIPTNPIAMGGLNLTNNQEPSEVVVSGQHVYLRYYSRIGHLLPWPLGGFHVFDVSDPANPMRVGSYDPGHGLSALEVSGAYAYVAFYDTGVSPMEEGLRVLDVSNPAQPVPLGVCTNAGEVNGMAV